MIWVENTENEVNVRNFKIGDTRHYLLRAGITKKKKNVFIRKKNVIRAKYRIEN